MANARSGTSDEKVYDFAPRSGPSPHNPNFLRHRRKSSMRDPETAWLDDPLTPFYEALESPDLSPLQESPKSPSKVESLDTMIADRTEDENNQHALTIEHIQLQTRVHQLESQVKKAKVRYGQVLQVSGMIKKKDTKPKYIVNRHGRQKAPLYKDVPNIIRESTVGIQLARAHINFMTGDYDEMINRAGDALHLAQKLLFRPLIGRCHFILGTGFFNSHRFQLATYHFHKASASIDHYGISGTSLESWKYVSTEAEIHSTSPKSPVSKFPPPRTPTYRTDDFFARPVVARPAPSPDITPKGPAFSPTAYAQATTVNSTQQAADAKPTEAELQALLDRTEKANANVEDATLNDDIRDYLRRLSAVPEAHEVQEEHEASLPQEGESTSTKKTRWGGIFTRLAAPLILRKSTAEERVVEPPRTPYERAKSHLLQARGIDLAPVITERKDRVQVGTTEGHVDGNVVYLSGSDYGSSDLDEVDEDDVHSNFGSAGSARFSRTPTPVGMLFDDDD